VVGVSLFLGGARPTSRASVQSAGQGFRLPAQRLQEEFARGGALMRVLLRYTQSFIGQMMQTAACNRHGSLEQRLCRWLLLSLDRSSGGELVMTHELIANGLGVRREGVTEAASRLQREGADSLPPRTHQGARPDLARAAGLRLLWGRPACRRRLCPGEGGAAACGTTADRGSLLS
jgi:CRP-like cAMP-binding protein